MRHVITITTVIELQKLGNAPDMLRRAADWYEARRAAGTHRQITGAQVALNDGDDVTTAKTRLTFTVTEQDLPDLVDTVKPS